MGANGNTFWASPVTEPKRAYRFLLVVNGLETWAVKKVTRPKWKVSEVAHDYINHKFYYPGRVEWEPMQVTLVDPVTKDTTGALMAMIMASGYRLPLDATNTRTLNKTEAVAAIGGISLVGLGGHPDAPGEPVIGNMEESEAGQVEKWELSNPWIQSVEMGEYAYSEDAILEMSVTFRYDFAKFSLMSGKGNALENWEDRALHTGATPALQQAVKSKKLIAGT